jgi:hypothetical protein
MESSPRAAHRGAHHLGNGLFRAVAPERRGARALSEAARAAGVGRDQVDIVPGNHDVDRAAGEDRRRKRDEGCAGRPRRRCATARERRHAATINLERL